MAHVAADLAACWPACRGGLSGGGGGTPGCGTTGRAGWAYRSVGDADHVRHFTPVYGQQPGPGVGADAVIPRRHSFRPLDGAGRERGGR